MKLLIVGASLDLNKIDCADIYIAADRGALTLIENNISPDLSVGDFDSVTLEELKLIKKKSKSFKSYSKDKDQTDLELAIKHALSFNPTEIKIIHATGKRLDHYISALHVIYQYQLEHPKIYFYLKNTDNLHFFLFKGKHHLKKLPYRYTSFFAFNESVKISYLRGVKYQVENTKLSPGSGLFTSNEIIDAFASLKIESGVALVIYSR